TSSAAMAGALLTIPLSTLLKFLPTWTNGSFPDFPFMDRMSIVFVTIIILMIVISVADRRASPSRTIEIDTSLFRFSPAFAVGSVLILGILTALYTVFW